MQLSRSVAAPQSRHPESGKFLLLPRNNKHDDVLFPNEVSFELFHQRPISKLPPIVPHFVGRNEETHKIVSSLLRSRFLNVYGDTGIGKSAVASNAIHYLNQRIVFPQGIFFINCAELCEFLHEEKELIRILQKSLNIQIEIESVDEIWEHIYQWECLIFADGCDPLLCEFLLQELLSSTLKPRVVITSRMDSTFVRSMALAIGILPSNVEILPLRVDEAVQLVCNLRRGIAVEHAHVIVDICGGSPSKIVHVLTHSET